MPFARAFMASPSGGDYCASLHPKRPWRQGSAGAGAADARAALDIEQRAVPAACDAIRSDIIVELLCERQAHVRTAIDIAEHLVAAADGETVEAAGAHFDDEAARGAVRDLIERAERDAGRRGGKTLGQGSFALGKSAQQAS
jgi:hypothetical protein